jgi:Flp pilus assembly pilin Flp
VEVQRMSRTSRRIAKFVVDESGPTMTEYGMLLLFIALLVMGIVKILGSNVLNLYNFHNYFNL